MRGPAGTPISRFESSGWTRTAWARLQIPGRDNEPPRRLVRVMVSRFAIFHNMYHYGVRFRSHTVTAYLS